MTSISNLVYKSLSNSTTRNTQVIDVTNENLRRFSSASGNSRYYTEHGIYNPIYTIFKYEPTQEVELVDNSLYRNIFKNKIASEVDYILNRLNTTRPWNEKTIQNLTDDKILISLNEELLTALNNINYLGGKKIALRNFISVIRRALMSGKLDELDVSHYLNIYSKQLNDIIVEFSESGNTSVTNEAAIGLLFENNIRADFTLEPDKRTRDELKRQRRLNTDILARVRTVKIDGNENPIYLNNTGLPVYMLDNLGASTINSNLLLGDGPGYYFSALESDNIEYPLECITDISAAYYVTPDLRNNILELVGARAEVIIRSSSMPGVNEFLSTYNPSADVSPMYFALDLSTVGDLRSNNPLVNFFSGSYVLLSDEDAIHHSKTYSLNITKVNLDYRDPLIHYARDTGKIDINQNDITFRETNTNNRSIVDQRIITRNLPFALILTPGCGSVHNPFNTMSLIEDYGNNSTSTVTRAISLIHDINHSESELLKPVLDETLIVKATDGNPYFGLYEKYKHSDDQGLIYYYNPNSTAFNRSYYYNGEYTNIQPPSSLRTLPIEAHFVTNILNKLVERYNPSQLTWWDIFRRLKLNELGELNLINFERLMTNLPSNLKDIPIREVLSTYQINDTGLEGDIHPEDQIILYEKDRENAKDY